jgi:hypothetical protein
MAESELKDTSNSRSWCTYPTPAGNTIQESKNKEENDYNCTRLRERERKRGLERAMHTTGSVDGIYIEEEQMPI